jgi:hypothetical protein
MDRLETARFSRSVAILLPRRFPGSAFALPDSAARTNVHEAGSASAGKYQAAKNDR